MRNRRQHFIQANFLHPTEHPLELIVFNSSTTFSFPYKLNISLALILFTFHLWMNISSRQTHQGKSLRGALNNSSGWDFNLAPFAKNFKTFHETRVIVSTNFIADFLQQHVKDELSGLNNFMILPSFFDIFINLHRKKKPEFPVKSFYFEPWVALDDQNTYSNLFWELFNLISPFSRGYFPFDFRETSEEDADEQL